MRVVVAGGHGKIALLFGEQASGDHEVVGLIRDPAQVEDLAAVGMRAEMIDLEAASYQEIEGVLEAADAIVFAAGAGPGSGAERKETVDYGAAVKCVEAASEAGTNRFVMISAMGTDHPPEDDSVFSVYLRAKARADRALMDSSLDWTVIRPGHLTDHPGTGRVRLDRHVPRGEIPRSDVAAVVAACLADDRSVRQVFEVVGGDTPIAEAVASLSS